MDKIYICDTVYHVYISLIKVIVNKESNITIMLAGNMIDVDKLVKKLVESKLFVEVCIIPTVKLPRFKNRLFKYRKLRNILKEKFDKLSLYDKEIYIFNDWNSIGYYLNLEKISYYLLEDGLDCYKKGGVIEQYYLRLNKISYKFRRFFKYGVFFMGDSPYMRSLEVNDKQELCVRKNIHVIEFPRKELINKLNTQERERVVAFFLEDKAEIDRLKQTGEGITLILTQPLYEDKVVKNEMIQILLYVKLIKQYGKNAIWIKPHPRDNVDYKKVFPQYNVIQEKGIPIEIFDFIEGVSCERIITAYSSSIKELGFCYDKITFNKKEVDQMCRDIENEIAGGIYENYSTFGSI